MNEILTRGMVRAINATAAEEEEGGRSPVWHDLVVCVGLLGVVVSVFVPVRISERRTIPLTCLPVFCFNAVVCATTATVLGSLEHAARAAKARAKRVRASMWRRARQPHATTGTRVWEDGHDACVRVEFYDQRGAIHAVVLDSLAHMAAEDCVRADEMVTGG